MKLNLKIKSGEEFNEFERIAKELMTNYLIVANNKEYNMVEIEFYYWSEGHEDPYVHKTQEQLSSGKWYFNGFGLDITFGNGNDIYGGILIRGVKSLDSVVLKENKYISGPSNVLKEFFSQYDAFSEEKSICIIKSDDKNKLGKHDPFASARIGLTKNKDDNKNYFAKPYRFITNINRYHKFKDKEKVVRELIKNNPDKSFDLIELLGYNINI